MLEKSGWPQKIRTLFQLKGKHYTQHVRYMKGYVFLVGNTSGKLKEMLR